MHSTSNNEFWSALLEKAYAKLFGSYEALKGGHTCEALADFTGGVTESFDVKDAPKNLFHTLTKAFQRKSMMGCSITGDPNVTEAKTPQGLIRGHAYSITKTSMVDVATSGKELEIPILRVRNPWGNEAEWNGAWSDQSQEWKLISEESRKKIGLTFDNDGEFWMSYADFRQFFTKIEICNLGPESLDQDLEAGPRKDWFIEMFEGQWIKRISAGGCGNFDQHHTNPQYMITITESDSDNEEGKTSVVVALMQKNRRAKHLKDLTVGFAIYHLTDEDAVKKPQPKSFFDNNNPVARSGTFTNSREVSGRFSLEPGKYLIVPSTFEPNEEGDFLIRVFSESKYTFEENEETVGIGEDDHVVSYSNIKPIHISST